MYAYRRLLLVLDGVGSNATLQAQVTEFVSALLRRTRDPRVLVSSEHTITSMLTDAQKVYRLVWQGRVVAADTLGSQLLPQIVSIYPLRNIHAAALFTALAPRKLRLEEMGASDNRTALLQFSKHPLIVVRDCSCRVPSGLMLLGCIPFSHRRSPMGWSETRRASQGHRQCGFAAPRPAPGRNLCVPASRPRPHSRTSPRTCSGT